MSSTDSTSREPTYLKDVPYSKLSPLNTIDICIPQSDETSKNKRKYWIVFIHGGAWRDPAITSSSFLRTQSFLQTSPITPLIAGYVSLNYRLSPHPSHPTSPSDPAHNAKHPDHINDIISALSTLTKSYPGFAHNYILAGHSCGATLALQVEMRQSLYPAQHSRHRTADPAIIPPLAIIGIEGIYDLSALVYYHSDQPIYREFVAGAFSASEYAWDGVSPARADWSRLWRDGKVVVLAHSRGDGLVEWMQAEKMEESFKAGGWVEDGDEVTLEMEENKKRVVELFEIVGQHDEVWEDGRECARAIVRGVELLVAREG